MNQNRLETIYYPVRSEKIGERFDGFRVAVLADLHDCTLGKGSHLLLEALKREDPDIILIAGDLITHDRKKKKVSWRNAWALIRKLAARWKVYYAPGNHERRWQVAGRQVRPSYAAWQKRLEQAGVVFLDNASVNLHRGGEVIRVTGLSLPLKHFARLDFLPLPKRWEGRKTALAPGEMRRLIGRPDPETFQILLAHSPEHAEDYGAWGADLVLAGHYHGGIMRLPVVGGVIATSFRLFPKYDRGRFPVGKGEMIVSAGLGTHSIPLRPFNPPELLIIILEKA